MIPYSILSQISLWVLAIALVLTYISPTFTKITDIQNKISIYQQEKQKVADVNQRLKELVGQMESVSIDDQKRLLMYMPNSVDTIAVPRDIKAIADAAGVVIKGIEYEGAVRLPAPFEGDVAAPTAEPHSFVVMFEGSYDQLKTILSNFEQNHYPLEVTEMQVQESGDGFLSATVKLLTYDHMPPLAVIPEAIQ